MLGSFIWFSAGSVFGTVIMALLAANNNQDDFTIK